MLLTLSLGPLGIRPTIISIGLGFVAFEQGFQLSGGFAYAPGEAFFVVGDFVVFGEPCFVVAAGSPSCPCSPRLARFSGGSCSSPFAVFVVSERTPKRPQLLLC